MPNSRRTVVIVVVVLINLILLTPMLAVEGRDEVDLWFFWGDGCDLCETAAVWLDELSSTFPNLVIHRREVWKDLEEQKRYIGMMEERGMKASWVPGFILAEKAWEGFNDSIAEELQWEVENLLVGGGHLGNPPPPSQGHKPPPGRTLNLGPLGKVDIHRQPLLTATLLIALVDGFNPCSLWVLTVLLAMILNTQSRARIAAVGGTFLVVTATVYGLFITGLFAALTVASNLGWIRWGVALFALGFAVINIKDYFTFKQGPSLTIPQRLKPTIFRGGREIGKDRPLPVVLAITVIFALGVALIELPCTAGFPVIWSGLVTEAGVEATGFIALLAAYLVVYLSIEIAVIAVALVSMRATRLQEIHGRNLKLIGGMVMAAMATVLLVAPASMEGISGSLYVVGGALLTSGLVIAVQRSQQSGKQV